MKKLLGILVLGLLWCNTGLAEIEFNCNLDVHVKNYSHSDPSKEENRLEEDEYDKWLDLHPYKMKVKITEDKVFTKTDAETESGLEGNNYEIIKNDRRYVVGKIIERDPEGIIVDHLIYDKKYEFLSMLYYSDFGVAIYEGYCN